MLLVPSRAPATGDAALGGCGAPIWGLNRFVAGSRIPNTLSRQQGLHGVVFFNPRKAEVQAAEPECQSAMVNS